MQLKITNIQDHYDAFMWAFAIWYWLSHQHEGQASDKYSVMSCFDTKHSMSNIPDIDFDLKGDELYDDENYQAIINYQVITEDNWKQINEEFEYYMENQWDKEE